MKSLKTRSWTARGGLVLATVLLAFSGCSDDPPLDEDTAGKRAMRAGSSGLSSGGSGTSSEGGGAGESVGTGGGAGEATQGGKGGKGGTGGGGAGKGGTSVADGGAAGSTGGPVCGDMMVDDGEECDDGNVKNGDGCSSQCTSKCEECEATYCDYGDYGDVEAMCFTLGAGDVALAGPAIGAPRSKLCSELVDCVRKSGCMGDSIAANVLTNPFKECYCGTGSGCVSMPAGGPCVAEFQRAAETEDDGGVENRMLEFAGQNYPELGFAVGRAAIVLQYCDLNACGRECYLGKASDPCSRCTLGSTAHESFDVGGAAVCGVPAVVCEHNESCAAVVACVRETNCAASTIGDCYAEGSGPCADPIEAAAGTSTPAEVIALLVPNGTVPELNYAVQLVACMKSSCSAECFE